MIEHKMHEISKCGMCFRCIPVLAADGCPSELGAGRWSGGPSPPPPPRSPGPGLKVPIPATRPMARTPHIPAGTVLPTPGPPASGTVPLFCALGRGNTPAPHPPALDERRLMDAGLLWGFIHSHEHILDFPCPWPREGLVAETVQ